MSAPASSDGSRAQSVATFIDAAGFLMRPKKTRLVGVGTAVMSGGGGGGGGGHGHRRGRRWGRCRAPAASERRTPSRGERRDARRRRRTGHGARQHTD